MAKEVMDIKEISEYLGFSETKIYRLVEKSEIPYTKIGGQYRFLRNVIDKWLSDKTVQPSLSHLEKIRKEKDPMTKRLLLIGLLTKNLKPMGIRPIIVGGQAVEFYTAGGYATRDIDLVSTGYKEVGSMLETWGFHKEGRHWVNENFETSIEIPGAVLDGDEEKISEIEIDDLKVYMIGIEDLIVDRLKAFVHWESEDDGNWVKELIELHRNDIDRKYLEECVRSEKNFKKAEEFLGEIMTNEDN